MPIYEYQCAACGHRFERLQQMSEERLRVCPECGKPELNKVISATSFHLKGGGWYADGYDKPKSSGAASGSDSSTAGSDA